jgi:hypothetical protein
MHPAAARLKIHSLRDAFDSVDVAARSQVRPIAIRTTSASNCCCSARSRPRWWILTHGAAHYALSSSCAMNVTPSPKMLKWARSERSAHCP